MSDRISLNLNWSSVQKALGEGTFSGYKIGILETEKLFRNFLENQNIPGKNIDCQIDFLKKYLSQFERLTYVRAAAKKIKSLPHFEISREETRQIIQIYYQAMVDIEEMNRHLGLRGRINLKLKYFLFFLKNKIRKIIFIFGTAIILIFFLEQTFLGQKIAKFIVLIINFLFLKFLLWLIIVILLIILVRKLMPKKPRIKIL